LRQAQRRGRDRVASLLQGDGERLPFRDGSFDALLAAGYVPHLRDADAGLSELARVTKPGGRLAIFHPIGRATLAARHGGKPSEGDVLAASQLIQWLPAAGWRLESIDDGDQRYLALATRV
jgi:SAM-dependent methyltransferase